MDAHIYWEALLQGTRQVVANSKIDPQEIQVIGFSSQGQTFIPIDRQGIPLYPAIIWLDNRGREVAARWKKESLLTDYQSTTGYPWIPGELTIFKIAWLLEHYPLLSKTWKFLWLPDFLIFLLTGEIATDFVTARMGGMYNYRSHQWEVKLLQAAGIGIDQLPGVVPPGTIVGYIRPDIAEQLGIPSGIPVCTGANDQLVSAIGAGNIDPGMVTETTGTALAVLTTISEVYIDDSFSVGQHAIPDRYYAMTFTNTSAILLKWLRDLCNRGDQDYAKFLEGVDKIPVGSDGLIILPHFSGKTPPHGDPLARGAFLGLTLAHTDKHLARAIMEACACMLRECLDPVKKHILRFNNIRSLGGAANNEYWLQMKADMLGISIERPACPESASLGAAILAAVATGFFSSISQAVQAWYHPSHVFEPDLYMQSAYQEVYTRYIYYSDLFYNRR